MRTAKLTVVGAGPGDEELITLKAIKAIENANVIMYDALINSTTPNENTGIGTIATIEDIVEEKQLSSPAIIVIGEVVERRVGLDSIKRQYTELETVLY